MSGKKKDENRLYHRNWGGARKAKKTRKAPFPITDRQVTLLKRIGEGNAAKGLESALKDWQHFLD